MTIFDFFGGKKKDVTPIGASKSGANALLDTKKTPAPVETPTNTGAGAVAEVPTIDFFEPPKSTPSKYAQVPQIQDTTLKEHTQTKGEQRREVPETLGESFEGGAMDWIYNSLKGLTGPIGQRLLSGGGVAGPTMIEKVTQGQKIGPQDIMKYTISDPLLGPVNNVLKMIGMVPEKYKAPIQERLTKQNVNVGEAKTEFFKNNPDLLPKYTTGMFTAIKNGDTKTLSDPNYRADLVGRGAGQMAPALTATLITRNPNVGLAMFYPASVQEAYEDVKNDKDIDLTDAQKQSYSLVLGGLTTAVENLSFGVVAKPFLKSVKKEIVGAVLKSPLKAGLMQVLESFGAEGSEEIIQQTITDVMGKIFGSERNRKTLEEYTNTFLEAGVGSLGAGGFGGATEFSTQKGINKEILSKPVEGGERFQEQQSPLHEEANKTTEKQEPKKEVKYQELYHGTQGDFDKFIEEKMGKGEGSDLFGKGVYLTDQPSVAKFYGTEQTLRSVKEGADMDKNSINKMLEDLDTRIGIKGGKEYVNEFYKGNNPIEAMETYMEYADNNRDVYKEITSLLGEEASARDLMDIVVFKDLLKGKRTLMKTTIDDNLNMLDMRGNELSKELKNDFTKRLVENKNDEKIKGLIYDLGGDPENNKSIEESVIDSEPVSLMNTLDVLNSKDIFERYTRERGYDGIKFSANQVQKIPGVEGDNYVIFDPENVKIIEREYYQQTDKSSTTEQESQEEAIAKAKELLPEVEIKTLEQIVNPKNGLLAYGSYMDGMISFAKTLTKTTAFHEVFHGYFDMFTDQKTKREILEIVKRDQGINTDLEAEERLAEKFAEHANNIQNEVDTKGNRRVLDFLDELRAKVKAVFGQGDKVKQLYEDILAKKRPGRVDRSATLERRFQQKSQLDQVLDEMDPVDENYDSESKQYLNEVEPIMKDIEEITAEQTNFEEMTDKQLDKFFDSGKYDKLSDFEQQRFDKVMNERLFKNPMQFADPERQKFIDRIAKAEYHEQRIGRVGDKKVGKETANKHSIEVAREKEGIMEDLGQYYQFENTNDSYDMYIQLRDVPVDQITYQPRKGFYVSKAEKQRRLEKRVDKRRTEPKRDDYDREKKLDQKADQEKVRTNIQQSIITKARGEGKEALEAKTMLNLMGKKPMPEGVVEEEKIPDDFYDDNSLTDKERKEALKGTEPNGKVEGFLNRWEKTVRPIGTLMENISKSIYGRVKKYDYDVAVKGQQDMKDSLPFLEKMKELSKKTPDDYFTLRMALSNRDISKSKEIMDKHGIEFPKKILDKIYTEGEEAGYDINFLEDYFPRVVRDARGLLGELKKDVNRSYVEDAINRIKQMRKGELTIEEEAEIVNSLIMGKTVDGVKLGSGNMKERTIKLVTKKLLKYYYTPEEALVRYISGMREAIEVGKLFGNSGELKTSIGMFLAKEHAEGNLSYMDAGKVQELLEAKFEKAKTNPFINWMKTVGYTVSLGSFSSSITQLGDLSFSIIENGIFRAMKQFGKSIAGTSELKAEDFALDNIGEEFLAQGYAKKVLSTVLKGTGFSWMDKRGKETYLNSTFSKLKSLAKKNNQDLNKELKEYFGDEMGNKIFADLKKGEATDEVRTYLFLKLSNVQPLTTTEMPIGYLKNPNARIFYMLKTFTLKQLDYVRKKGVREARKNPKTGVPKLARMMFIIMMMNGVSDELKNLTLGRKYNSLIWRLLNGEDIGPALSNLFRDNLMKMFGLTKYSIYEVKTDGIDKALQGIFLSVPPLQIPANLIADLVMMYKKTFPEDPTKKEDIKFEDFKFVQMVPWIGKPMYRWAGKGQAGQAKSLSTEKKKIETERTKSVKRVRKGSTGSRTSTEVKRVRK